MSGSEDSVTRSGEFTRADFDDFLAAMQRHMQRKIAARWSEHVGVVVIGAIAFVAASLLLPVMFPNLFHDSVPSDGFWVGIAVTVVIGGILIFARQVMMGRRFARLEVRVLGARRLVLSAAGATVETPMGSTHIPWSAMRAIEKTERILMFWVDDYHGQVVPRMIFADQQDEAEALAAIARWAPHLGTGDPARKP